MSNQTFTVLLLLLPPTPPPYHRSSVRATKDLDADIKREVTNGITKGLKLDSVESMARSKTNPSLDKGGCQAQVSNSPSHSLWEPKPELCADSSRKVLKTPVLQKTSSTITLQATKVQPEPRAPALEALSPSREEKRRLATSQPTTSPTTRPSPENPEVVSTVATRKTPVESQKEWTLPKFESKPQSLEVCEHETVKFRCDGE